MTEPHRNPEQTLLSIRGLRTSFGNTEVLHGVDLEIRRGEVLTLIGESGSGKSVLARSILGLAGKNARTTGVIEFNGTNLLDLTDAEMHKMRGADIGIIVQDAMAALNPMRTIGYQLCETIVYRHPDYRDNPHNKTTLMASEEVKKLAVDYLKRVGITAPSERMRSYAHQLSGGMRQRVMIAIALACEPKLLIADEPTTALDVTIQAQILELMQELRKKLGMSIIMITHDLGVVASMCEKIAVMYAGHIVEYGTTDEIFYQPGHEYTKGLINSIPKLNTAEHERHVPIEGTPVDLLNPPAGCPFAPRCKNCMKICLSKMPPRTELSDTHYTYCWLQQKAAFEKGEKAE